MKYLYLYIIRICVITLYFSLLSRPGLSQVSLSGELRKWHTITLDIEGPEASEHGNPNPFLDYRLDVTFVHGLEEVNVPGYFAADGNASNTSSESGNHWKVHFTPSYTGDWKYVINFKKGANISISTSENEGTPVTPIDGYSGAFTIVDSDKTGRDFRSKGRLIWNGAHYWRFEGSNKYFVKGGTDSPENFLGCTDFDGTTGDRTHDWGRHLQDWNQGDPSWKNGLGKGIIGAINYLASKGLNSIGPITMAVKGDVKGIYPYISSSDRVRFDCSKLDQWQIVIDHAQKKGIHLQFKLSEHENYDLEGLTINDRHKIYYREMVARFGHFLGVSWNIGEEFGDPDNPHSDFSAQLARYLDEINPYPHNITIHNWGGKENQTFEPHMGSVSSFTGTSMQGEYYRAHKMALAIRSKSAQQGKPWIIAHDEQPPVNRGLPMDGLTASNPASPNEGEYTQEDVRKKGLWGHLMAGGAGMEWFWGTDWPDNQTDFEGSDYRSRDQFWDYVHYAIKFFEEYLPFHEMHNANALIGNLDNNNSKYCFAKEGEIYVVYLPEGGGTDLNLSKQQGIFSIYWFNPRTGEIIIDPQSKEVKGGTNIYLGDSPDNNDWVVLLRNEENINKEIQIAIVSPTDSSVIKPGSTIEIYAEVSSGLDNIQSVSFLLGRYAFTHFRNPPFSFTWRDIPEGEFTLTAKAIDLDGNEIFSNPVHINVTNDILKEEKDNEDQCDEVFREKDGVIVMEAENTQLSQGWEEKTNISGFTGRSYIEYMGQNYLDEPGNSPLTYKFEISSPGTYRFDFRTKVGYGSDPSEHNDTWVRFPDADDFYGELDGKKAYPAGVGKSPIFKGSTADGWGKGYSWGTTDWTFRTKVSDLEGLEFFADFNSPGIYTLELSGRSKGHFIDRMILYKKEVSQGLAHDIGLTEYQCDSSNTSIRILSPQNNSTYFEGEDIHIIAGVNNSQKNNTQLVNFYVNSEWIGEDHSPPFTATWYDVYTGDFLLAAELIDEEGRKTVSQGINIKVISGDMIHDIPGQIEAEDFSREKSDDVNDIFLAESFGIEVPENNAVNYQISVKEAGFYQINLGMIESQENVELKLLLDSLLLTSVRYPEDISANNQILIEEIFFKAGIYDFTILPTTGSLRLDWLAITKNNIIQPSNPLNTQLISLYSPQDGIQQSPLTISWQINESLIQSPITMFELEINGEIITLTDVHSLTLHLDQGSYLCRIRAFHLNEFTDWSYPVSFWVP